MTTGPARRAAHCRYLRLTSIAMVVAGLSVFVLTAAVTLPNGTRTTTALNDRGVRAHATVTRCILDGNGEPEPSEPCWVRFTPVGGAPVESRLALRATGVEAGRTLDVVYDPQDTTVVAKASDLDFWHSLGRNAVGLLTLVVSAGMVLAGVAALVLIRLLTPRLRRHAERIRAGTQVRPAP